MSDIFHSQCNTVLFRSPSCAPRFMNTRTEMFDSPERTR